jgi:hypothetical protein
MAFHTGSFEEMIVIRGQKQVIIFKKKVLITEVIRTFKLTKKMG